MKGWAIEVTTETEIREEVRAQAAQGVDFVKLYRHLPSDLVAAAIDEARRQGLQVIGHLGETTWGEAATAGIDMLVHSGWGTPMDEIVNLDNPDAATDSAWYHGYADAPNGYRFGALARTLVEEEVVVVPTLSIHQAAGAGKDASLLPLFQTELAPEAYVDDWWGEGWETRHPQYDPDSEEEGELMATVLFPGILNIVKAYHERGVRLGVGTDVGNSWMTPGFVYHHELELYQDSGIPSLAILTMATHNGAEALGILDDTGTIEVGKRANLVVLTSDPTEDIRNTRDIEQVFLNGQPFHPENFLQN